MSGTGDDIPDDLPDEVREDLEDLGDEVGQADDERAPPAEDVDGVDMPRGSGTGGQQQVVTGDPDATDGHASDDEVDEGEPAWTTPPEIRTGRLGVLSEWWSLRKQRRKRRKAANSGTVEWYLVDGAWPEPEYVEPKANGTGVPTVERDGRTYAFPKTARLPSERSGMYVMIHERGASEPINLRDPARDSLDADVVDSWLTMSVTSSSPGLFDGLNLDLDPQTILAGGILLIILWAVAQNVLGSGIV
jgi:hypothetical protein